MPFFKKSKRIDRDALRAALAAVPGFEDAQADPDHPARIHVVLTAAPDREAAAQNAVRAALKPFRGIRDIRVILTGARPAAPDGETPHRQQAQPAADPHGMAKNPPLNIPARRIVAVASGKGGVGKSTVCFNLAAALAAKGQKVGLLDGDIYGPSVPTLTGTAGARPDRDAAGRIEPVMAHGLKLMSIAYLMENDAPLIWRGPMVQTALYQLLRDVNWASEDDPLDWLFIDMPPGTGDAQLTLAQKVPASGAIIVTTPQDLALIDARKAIAMFRQTNVPILGLIENMSTHICSNCGHEDPIFGQGGAKAEAEKRGIPFLGDIPLSAALRTASDAGRIAPDSRFTEIAAKL